MKPESLGYQTDFMFRRHAGEIEEKEGYWVVRSPQNPTFYWGNFLLFTQPPQASDLERWPQLFAQEIGHTRHLAFGWDSPQGEVGQAQLFVQQGFNLLQSVVLTAQAVHAPPKVNPKAQLKPLEDWQQWMQMELAVNRAAPPHERHDEAGHLSYLQGKAAEYEGMISAGLGQWFGAYLDGQLAASLGLFVWEGVGRFQTVSTHPQFRRQGLCGTLVHHAATVGLQQMGARQLVMVADPDYVAIGIYESVGFVHSERQMGLEWWPRPLANP